MRNFTANAADNHSYRAVTLRRIRNIFASIPEPDAKSVAVWIETVTGTLHEYFELIWPNGLGVTFENRKDADGLDIRFVIERSADDADDKANTGFLCFSEHLKAKEMHKFFDIKIDPEAVLELATVQRGHFTDRVAVRFVCNDPANFNKSIKTAKRTWLMNPARIISAVDQRVETEDNIVKLMSGDSATMPDPFNFAEFCRVFMRTREHSDKRDLIASILQEQIRSLGFRPIDGNALHQIRFDLAAVLGFWPQASENHVKKDGTGYYDSDLVETWDAEMTLAVWTHIQPIRPEIFTVEIIENKVAFIAHEFGRTAWMKGRRQMTDRVKHSLAEVLEA